MQLYDCFLELRTYPSSTPKDDEYVFICVTAIKKMCVVEEIHVSSTCIEYFDIETHNRRQTTISRLQQIPSEFYLSIRSNIDKTYEKSKSMIFDAMRPSTGHKTTAGDYYYRDGVMEHVIGYVEVFRPSWNASYVTIDKDSYYCGHHRFGVSVDKYEKNPDIWYLIDQAAYDSIVQSYAKLIAEIQIMCEKCLSQQN